VSNIAVGFKKERDISSWKRQVSLPFFVFLFSLVLLITPLSATAAALLPNTNDVGQAKTVNSNNHEGEKAILDYGPDLLAEPENSGEKAASYSASAATAEEIDLGDGLSLFDSDTDPSSAFMRSDGNKIAENRTLVSSITSMTFLPHFATDFFHHIDYILFIA
jgi:hypothetical protein